MTDKNQVQSEKQQEGKTNSLSDEDLIFILLVILCFIVPPVIAGVVKGWDSRDFLISLILFLLAAIFFNVIFFIGTLIFILAIIHALLVLFEVI